MQKIYYNTNIDKKKRYYSMIKDKTNIKLIKERLTVNSDIIFYETTDSTNLRLKEMAKNGAKTGTGVIAENQTSGRGRLGRSFFSPSDSGIYMSLLLRPDGETDTGKITEYTAVAVCNAIEKALGEAGVETSLGIKWVNDIQKDGKKVCGILAEGGFLENGERYVIVGIGINVYPPQNDFPKEIESIATYLLPSPVSDMRSKIISGIINNFYSYSPDFIHDYRKRSTVTGKLINVHKRDMLFRAFATHIDDNCNLVVKYENGETEALSFGEISVRTVE